LAQQKFVIDFRLRKRPFRWQELAIEIQKSVRRNPLVKHYAGWRMLSRLKVKCVLSNTDSKGLIELREGKVNVLYYPDAFVSRETLKKAILIFDEIHFMDRPSIMFGAGPGQFGTIGMDSPLRAYEASFRSEGVPLFVHHAPSGPVDDEWYEQIKSDVNDPEFLKRFQIGLDVSATFRALQIAPGNYGEFGDQDDVAKRIIAVDLCSGLAAHANPMALFEDSTIRHFDLSNAVGCTKSVVAHAVTCSAKLNFALSVGTKHGFFPLADATPYGDLLGAKYARAITRLEPAKNKIQLTDLSLAIFDELVPAELLENMSITDVIRYRKAAERAREEFLEHLEGIQIKQAAISVDGDYGKAIDQLVQAEIRPAARKFKNNLQTIRESLFGSLVKGTVGFLGTSSAVTVFGDLSWERLLALAGSAAAYTAASTIDAILAQRKVRRECSISYLLSLDK
jgi:hypothetical protein